MTAGRMYHGCALLASSSSDSVYAAGGYTYNSYLKSVEKMTRLSGGSWGSWTVVGNLPVTSNLYQFPMIAWSDGRMYTLGGQGSSGNKQIFSSSDGASWRTENITLAHGEYEHWAISTEDICQ